MINVQNKTEYVLRSEMTRSTYASLLNQGFQRICEPLFLSTLACFVDKEERLASRLEDTMHDMLEKMGFIRVLLRGNVCSPH